MSLHQLAHHVQSAGRGDDKVLVHMTPGEVKGLQAMAMAHGGSLTINPHTGLPEAGFLSALLPIAAGFVLGPAGIGIAETAMGAAAMVGGATTLATGSLSKGLMAGMGAYGGFGLAEGLATAGAEAAGAAGAGANAANAGANAAEIGAGSGMQNASSAMSKGFAGDITPANSIANASGAYNPANLAQAPLNQADYLASHSLSNVPVPTANAVQLNAPVGGTTYYNEAAIGNVGPTGSVNAEPTYFDKVKQGFSNVTSSGDNAWKFVKAHPMPFISVGLGALQDYRQKQAEDAANAANAGKTPSYIRPYEYSVEQDPNAYLANSSTAERMYFKQPRLIAKPIERVAASGGLMRMAEGGSAGNATLALPDRPPIEQATDNQAIGSNMSFPMANLRAPTYSSPTNRPLSQEVVDSSGGPEVNPYSGEQMFAGGGIARFGGGGAAAMGNSEPTTSYKYTYDPETMQYTETTTETPAAMPSSVWGPGGDVLHPNQGVYMPSGWANGYGVYEKQKAPEPVVTTKTLGGIMEPYIPPGQTAGAQNTTMVPNINIPQQQSVNQQLGLENFYQHMDTQLAQKAAEMGAQKMAGGGISGMSHLGGYSDGGRLLKGPGDGVSDSIPAVIGRRQPARLADGEFVVPARIVSELGNGSTEAGARKLYAMMDRVQKARGKTVGKNQVAKNTRAEKLLPA